MPVAVVTGGASGLGLALGERCAALGLDLVLLDLDGERAVTEAAQVAEAHGVVASGIVVDVANALSVEAAAATVDERFGVVDLVISNVGVQLFGTVESFTDDEWKWLLDVNVIGSARVARAFLPLLHRAENPRLAFTTSSSILDPASRLGAYQASKFAVWGLAETLRLELAEDGIGVSVIFPSGMITRHLETSEAAQPSHLRRPIAGDGDLDAMIASNPEMAAMLATPDVAAAGVIEAVLAGEPYVVTHGDLVQAVTTRAATLTRAAEAARSTSAAASAAAMDAADIVPRWP
jgi:NAD(P)-dependent dehydrogenase (short-subunit alcohol dehydrogenase family)